jgi:hypothetical protein
MPSACRAKLNYTKPLNNRAAQLSRWRRAANRHRYRATGRVLSIEARSSGRRRLLMVDLGERVGRNRHLPRAAADAGVDRWSNAVAAPHARTKRSRRIATTRSNPRICGEELLGSAREREGGRQSYDDDAREREEFSVSSWIGLNWAGTAEISAGGCNTDSLQLKS